MRRFAQIAHLQSIAVTTSFVFPPGAVARSGDLLLVTAINTGGTTVPGTPAGWTRFASAAANGIAMGAFWAIAPSGSGGLANMPSVFPNATITSISVVRGVDHRDPIAAVVTGSGTATVPLASITPPDVASMLVASGYLNAGAIAAPAGMASQYSFSGTFTIAMQQQVFPAASGAKTFTSSGSPTKGLGWMAALRPASTPSRPGGGVLSRLTVWKRGWRSPLLLDAAGIIASWGVSTPGRFSALVPARSQLLGGEDWLGRWIRWEHPTMGRWAGYIEDAPITGSRGAVELSAVGFGQLLAKRRTKRRYRPESAPAGALITRALADVKLDAGMPFTISVTESGPPVNYEFRADMVMQVFSAMEQATGQEWTALLDDALELEIIWRAQVGNDETTRVVFTEGVNILDPDTDQTITDMVNDLLALADDQQFERAAGARMQNQGSVGRFGRFHDTRHYKGLVDTSALGPRAERDLVRLSRPVVTLAVRVRHDDWRLRYVRDGTTIRIVSASANAVYSARVLARDVDLDQGIVTLTLDAVQDVTRQTQEAVYDPNQFTTA